MTKFLTLAAALLMTAGTAIAASDSAMSSGTVTKIDAKWNKITVDHGPLENLDMPAMKMVFVLADPAMLEGLSEGAQINFVADRVNGKLTITELVQYLPVARPVLLGARFHSLSEIMSKLHRLRQKDPQELDNPVGDRQHIGALETKEFLSST
jgi:Cu/Ag efflux protein CusF